MLTKGLNQTKEMKTKLSLGKWFLFLASYFRLLHGIMNTLRTRKILIYIKQCKLIGKASNIFPNSNFYLHKRYFKW